MVYIILFYYSESSASISGVTSTDSRWKQRQRDNHQTSGQSSNQAQAKRKPTAPPISEDELHTFLKEKPSDIVSKLVSRNNECLALLNQDKFNDNAFMLTLRVLSCMCDVEPVSASISQDLNITLGMVESSSFLSKHLSRYLVGLSTKQPHNPDESNTDDVQTLATDVSMMLKLLQVFLQHKPSGYSEVGVVLILLEKVVTSAAMDNAEFDSQGELMLQVQQLNKSFNSLEKSQQSAKQRSMVKPPPDNFRNIPIFPESSEIRKPTKPFLRKNIIKGRYENVEHYLDVQFRLLREDFVAPLREGVTEFLSDSSSRLQDIRIYHDVEIVKKTLGNNGFVYRLQFDVTRGLKRIRWESSKRLIYGSFICLTKDNFEHILCATVENRSPEDLANGLVDVRFLTETAYSPRGHFVMAESAAYFEAYRHVLQGLQQMKDDNFPFEKYIVDVTSNIDPPEYLKEDDSDMYDLRSLVVGKENSFDYNSETESFLNAAYVQILDRKSWPTAGELHLDESQKAALQAALTKEFAIIQGPPGTGKTYIGLKIIELLLYNKLIKAEDASPILVVCYTNHALDQFLEGIIAFGERNVIRVGGRSNSECLKSKNLSQLRRDSSFKHRHSRDNVEQQNVEQMKQRLHGIEQDIQSTLLKVDLAKKVILNATTLINCMSTKHLSQMSQNKEDPTRNLLMWLKVVDLVNGNDGSYEEELSDIESDECIDVEEEINRIQQDRHIDDEYDEYDSGATRERRESYEHKVFNQIAAYGVDCNKRCGTEIKADIKKPEMMTDKEAARVRSIATLSLCDRWRLYRLWVKTYIEQQEEWLNECRQRYEQLSKEIQAITSREDVDILRKARVIGMTTTGAAKCRSVLQLLGPRIVVVEEAAEVLEAHILTTLTAKCQHLILIGDHQQLKPNPTVYRLAKVFNMDTSLFERMISNGVPCQSLTHQHRMRPEISKLMKKHFYKNLHDDESVMGMDDVKGVVHNMFFIDHHQLEDEGDDNISKSNQYEAEVLVELCRYLLHQGYKPSQITVLTTYLGQLFSFKKLMDKGTFEGVRVCVVDNFQGEENDIILLSMVRSNKEGSIGFLKTSNRVCVALSRARMGFYCIGNASILKKATIWQDIIGTLEVDNRIGSSLPLVCQNHSVVSKVASAKDFRDKVPHGGCNKPCIYRLQCGHVCASFCHPYDLDHKKYICKQPCTELCKRNEHLHKLKCFEKGRPCKIKVSKSMPDCDHVLHVECHEFDSVTCTEPCPKTLMKCGHSCKMLCGQRCTKFCEVEVARNMPKCGHNILIKCAKNPDVVACSHQCDKLLVCGHRCLKKCSESCTKKKKEDAKIHTYVKMGGDFREFCTGKCKKTLLCGHPCPNKCGEPCPKAEVDSSIGKYINLVQHSMRDGSRLPMICEIYVQKNLPNCSHTVTVQCYKDIASFSCSKTCNKELLCGHRCTGKCSQPCKCKRLFDRKLPSCGHLVQLPCFKEVDSYKCSKKCQKELECGHQCPNKCSEPCPGEDNTTSEEESLIYKPARTCQHSVKKTFPDCGHSVVLSCYKDIESVLCSEKCSKILSCGHKCTNRCGEPCPSDDPTTASSADDDSSSEQDFNFDTKKHSVSRKCQESINKKLSVCGHILEIPCHKNTESLVCPKPCEKILSCGHHCPKRCGDPCPSGSRTMKYKESASSEDDDDQLFSIGIRESYVAWQCQEPVKKKLPECGHVMKMPCHKNLKSVVCPKPCEKIQSCGHLCPNKCGEMCLTSERCKVQVEKTLPLCGHVIKAHCCKNVDSVTCTDKCEKVLSCGHSCPNICSEPCPGERSTLRSSYQYMLRAPHMRCEGIIKMVLTCGHVMDIPCWKADSTITGVTCREPCGHVLGCGHTCSGTCDGCVLEHKPCKSQCGKLLLCGHTCINKCADECSPNCKMCDQPSSLRSRLGCARISMEPSQQRRISVCKHKTKKSQLWTNKCTLPCSQKLPCNHFCIGVCGEPCPPFCIICNKTSIVGNSPQGRLRPRDTFIYLQDCGHICETRLLDKMVASSQSSSETDCVQIRFPLCPKCEEPIHNCPRYDDLIKIIHKSVQSAKQKFNEDATTSMSYVVASWMRCPKGHVFCQEEKAGQNRHYQEDELLCPECTQ